MRARIIGVAGMIVIMIVVAEEGPALIENETKVIVLVDITPGQDRHLVQERLLVEDPGIDLQTQNPIGPSLLDDDRHCHQQQQQQQHLVPKKAIRMAALKTPIMIAIATSENVRLEKREINQRRNQARQAEH